jgi:hypothetical protein
MNRRAMAGLLLLAASAAAQRKYSGPRPPQPDVPYLLHASNLVATEIAEAKEEPRRDDAIAYMVSGASSSVKTPLASPIFLYEAGKIAPEQLEIYAVDVSKSGNREVVFYKRKKDKNPRSFRLSIAPLTSNLYRLEVVESLENGEYCLTPSGANQVFCFQVF